MTPRVSVIIPTWNEVRRIGRQLAALETQRDVYEVIVVDGGSQDGTPDLVRASGARLVQTRRGRGPQLNAGAEVARGDVLIFLHADVTLPPEVVRLVQTTLDDTRVVGGAFTTHTILDRPGRLPAALVRLADIRSRYTRLPYGDQAIFVRRHVFTSLGGFPDQPLFEDLEFSRRLRAAGRVRTIPCDVLVSGRRFAARPVYFALVMNVLPLLYRAGVSPSTLARVYGDIR